MVKPQGFILHSVNDAGLPEKRISLRTKIGTLNPEEVNEYEIWEQPVYAAQQVNIGGIEISTGESETCPLKQTDDTIWLYSDADSHGGTFSKTELEAVLRQFINDRI